MIHHLLLELRDISWLTVYMRGCTAHVQVVERDKPPALMKDGDKTHTSGFMGLDEYSETVDGVTYKYTKSLTGKWTKKVADKVDYTDFIDDDTLAALLTSSNYTKSENEKDTWYYSADAELENLKEVKIVFEDEDGSISFTYNYNGFDVNGTIEFTKLGEVTVDLPTVS